MYWCKWILEIDSFRFCPLFWPSLPYQFFVSDQFVVHNFFLVCSMSNLQLEERLVDSIMVSNHWVGICTNNIHLLQFKIQGHLLKRGLRMPVFQNSFRRNFKGLFCLLFQSPFYAEWFRDKIYIKNLFVPSVDIHMAWIRPKYILFITLLWWY